MLLTDFFSKVRRARLMNAFEIHVEKGKKHSRFKQEHIEPAKEHATLYSKHGPQA